MTNDMDDQFLLQRIETNWLRLAQAMQMSEGLTDFLTKAQGKLSGSHDQPG
jgi:hypothetical protein